MAGFVVSHYETAQWEDLHKEHNIHFLTELFFEFGDIDVHGALQLFRPSSNMLGVRQRRLCIDVGADWFSSQTPRRREFCGCPSSGWFCKYGGVSGAVCSSLCCVLSVAKVSSVGYVAWRIGKKIPPQCGTWLPHRRRWILCYFVTRIA
jgi:hypothetical protein